MARDFYSNWAEEPPVETVLMDSYRWGEAGEAAAGFSLMASSPITRANIHRKGDRATERERKEQKNRSTYPLFLVPLVSLSYIPFPVLPILLYYLPLFVLPILHSLPYMCSLSYIHYPVCTH